MMNLYSRSLKPSGQLIVSTASSDMSYDVKEKLPNAMIEIKYMFSLISGGMGGNNTSPMGYRILPEYSLIKLRGQIIFWGIPEDLELHLPSMGTTSIFYYTDRNHLNIVEAQRNDDIKFNVSIIAKYHPKNISSRLDDLERFKIDFTWKLSQKEWNTILENVGYSAKWLIEIDRPKLEGFDEIIEFIKKAEESLYSKRDPEDVLSNLRKAKDAFQFYFDKHKKDISETIDKGSIGEDGHPKKSDRINKIYNDLSDLLDNNIFYKDLSDLLNIGPHSDKYKVTYEDALLGYREFISLFSYLSKIISQMNNKDKDI